MQKPQNKAKRSRRFVLAALSLALALGVAACGGTSNETGGDGSGGTLSLVAYSTPQEAYEQALIPAFNKTSAGKDVSFKQSYGSSGDQSRLVSEGLPADVVALSLQPDVDKLVESGDVAKDWNKDKYDGFVTNSVVVFAVRKGNPKNIKTWDDIVKDDVEVITPNPFTSGGARWNIMAAYGSQIEQGKSDAEALDFVKKVLENTPVQDKSARESLQTFSGGKGDVLLAYENEALTAQDKGEELDFILPDETILIQNPIAVTTTSKDKKKAQAFVDFLRSDEGQKLFAERGYRPVVKDLVDEKKFPTPSGLFEITKFGGWGKVTDEFFDPAKGKVAKIEEGLGVSTEK